jgi:hypothetical protein
MHCGPKEPLPALCGGELQRLNTQVQHRLRLEGLTPDTFHPIQLACLEFALFSQNVKLRVSTLGLPRSSLLFESLSSKLTETSPLLFLCTRRPLDFLLLFA